MMRSLCLCLLVVCLLTGCAEYWRGFREKQEWWLNYVNSPAYNERVYSSSFRDADGVQHLCYTVCTKYHCDLSCDGR